MWIIRTTVLHSIFIRSTLDGCAGFSIWSRATVDGARRRPLAQVAVASDGQITIPRVDVAVDCGLVVNPDRVRAQFEGATIMGIGNTLYSNITIKEGRTEQSNFVDYLVARTDITPDTRVHIVESNAPPGGVGEPGVPPIAPAICNAIFAASGKRIRALPVDPAQLKTT